MLRVLHCIYDDPQNPWVGGGGGVRVYELYRRLRDRVDATVLTGNYPGATDTELDGVRYQRLGARRPYAWSRWTYARAASRRLERAEYDAAVFDFSVYTPLRLPADRPVGVTVHHLTGPTARARWGVLVGSALAWAERRMLSRVRWLSATSQVTQSALREIVAHRAEIVPVGAGVADEFFDLARREADYILFFGRLDWFQKGLDTLLDALDLLRREHPGLQLWIAGRGKDRERVEQRANELGVSEHLRLLGSVSEVERLRLFAGARVLLMPSRFEGFGMVAAEAMAAGVPIVASAAGALPEVVDSPSGGVLVPPGDAAQLAAEVAKLLADAGRREALSRSARAAAERFRWENVACQHLEFLTRIAGEHATR
jgi:glycosyltransferase involved in cell wall biosynthesis